MAILARLKRSKVWLCRIIAYGRKYGHMVFTRCGRKYGYYGLYGYGRKYGYALRSNLWLFVLGDSTVESLAMAALLVTVESLATDEDTVYGRKIGYIFGYPGWADDFELPGPP